MRRLIFLLIIIFLCPIGVYAEDLIPNGKSGILMEANSGKIIYEKNMNDKLSIASLTKMVGQIIILDEVKKGHIKWSDEVTVSRNASSMGGSQIYLEEGEKITVDDLMKGISVASGNDAIVAMAEYISGSEEKFVKRMNDVARKLKLKNSNFVNCTGLDEKNHYSSSYDLALVAKELLTNYPEIIKYSSIYEDYLRENTDRKFWLVNTNKLINFYDGADGLKTGHTDAAQYCLAATAKRKNLRLIAVVLGEKDSKVRNNEVMQMLDYGFNTTKLNCLKKKGSVVDVISFEKADKKNENIVLENDLCVLEDKDHHLSYKYEVKINDYKLPITKGEVVGEMIVKNKGKVVGRENLIVNSNINNIGLFDFIVDNIKGLLFGV